MRLVLEINGTIGIQFRGRVAGFAEFGTQCHGEAPGVGSGDQFFRVGTLTIFEAAFIRVGRVLEHGALGG